MVRAVTKVLEFGVFGSPMTFASRSKAPPTSNSSTSGWIARSPRPARETSNASLTRTVR